MAFCGVGDVSNINKTWLERGETSSSDVDDRHSQLYCDPEHDPASTQRGRSCISWEF
jgi:hypothetical protein